MLKPIPGTNQYYSMLDEYILLFINWNNNGFKMVAYRFKYELHVCIWSSIKYKLKKMILL